MSYIQGYIEQVIYQDNDFFILSVAVHDTDFVIRDKTAKVHGNLYGLAALRGGIPLRISGEWHSSPKWGRQLKPSGWYPWSSTNNGRIRFLNECIEGFEDVDLTTRLVTAFGEEVFDALSDPVRAKTAIPETDSRYPQIDSMVLHWRNARTLSELAMFLQSYDLSNSVKDIYARFGHDVIEIISKNPYHLLAVEGFTFDKADRIATRLGIPRDDPRRVEGAVLWLLRVQAQQGHLYVRRGDLPTYLNELLQTDQVDPFDIDNLYGALQAAVTSLEERKMVSVDPNVGVYLPDLYLYERGACDKLAKFLTPSDLRIDLDVFLAEYQQGNQIELSEAQREAVRKLVEHRVLVLTGLPGTGKTSLIRALVSVFKRSGLSFALMAPTGIAAKRLAFVTGAEAKTIHRTFGFNGASWGYYGGNKLSVGAVILDEASMIDQELFYRVLDALHPNTMIVLVGDDAQLPSVAPGNVMRELLSCPQVPNVRLTQIFRQASTSGIVMASHKIHQGKSPLVNVPNLDSEFQFIPIGDEEKIVAFIVEAAAKLKGRDANFQVLSPKYEGGVGVNLLNERLKERLNPSSSKREWKLGSSLIREGDRLMVIKNDYLLNIYNGDMGKLKSIEGDHLVVTIHGIGVGSMDTQVKIPKASASRLLKLAYAITVHKSQGSEFDTILLPITRSQGRMLQRNLFYTAVTRARKKVWLLGDSEAVLRAIDNDQVVQRNTVLGRVLSYICSSGVGCPHD
jgi:exodeoxyribonuclease V alpha subunit